MIGLTCVAVTFKGGADAGFVERLPRADALDRGVVLCQRHVFQQLHGRLRRAVPSVADDDGTIQRAGASVRDGRARTMGGDCFPDLLAGNPHSDAVRPGPFLRVLARFQLEARP